jgi:hypothetical protein
LEAVLIKFKHLVVAQELDLLHLLMALLMVAVLDMVAVAVVEMILVEQVEMLKVVHHLMVVAVAVLVEVF